MKPVEGVWLRNVTKMRLPLLKAWKLLQSPAMARTHSRRATSHASLRRCCTKLATRRVLRHSKLKPESKVVPESAQTLNSKILAGEWKASIDMLASSKQLRFESSSGRKIAHLLVLQQIYVECVTSNRIEDALACLRQDIEPFIVDNLGDGDEWPSVVNKLACMVLYSADKGALWKQYQRVMSTVQAVAGIDCDFAVPGVEASTAEVRNCLVRNLAALVSPTLLVPEGEWSRF